MTGDDPMAAHGGGVWERYYCHFREGHFTFVYLGRSFYRPGKGVGSHCANAPFPPDFSYD